MDMEDKDVHKWQWKVLMYIPDKVIQDNGRERCAYTAMEGTAGYKGHWKAQMWLKGNES